MWNLSFTPPEVIQAQVLSRLPIAMRRPVRSEWADPNKRGHVVDCFLEEPAFDPPGNRYLSDIPHGRILRLTPLLEWQEVATNETARCGWPTIGGGCCTSTRSASPLKPC